MKLNGTHQLLVCAADVNTLGVHTIKNSTKALTLVSKENELEVNADKTKYMGMSRDQGMQDKVKI